MRTSTERIARALEQPALGPPHGTARVTRLRTERSSDDARRGTLPALGVEAWPWHMVPPSRSADADATEAASSAWPLSHELYQDAQRRRAALFGDLIATAVRKIGGVVLRTYARYRQFRDARATYLALQELDDRTLRDLGFAREEIRSVAAEMAGEAEYTRRLARPTWPAQPSLFDLFFRQ
jgi:uncharacterized protein YjiS (DUF1127 family)